ncbi:MAG: hypothetical protein ACD_30C00042G0004 [uncultured bacterium]|uniref:Uncharacterized protein n=2 Tax=Candidatus Daviesiibacteriota TaxID=1752718 RepID=A0A0G0F6B7_9BACT|nr:MAG: hypothetical protein ACD_30C00042G0004 [uncultured bacterium]KKQ09065.1 MAG: hypothetical protein US19_C0017G0010 [Candidatus Daviesbacteria bacterium GW2011_GWB1_36_5]KKQ16102.1 MAG: hypothetical protein US28_C0005G0017 [Candidatus Daviesbacteria bacterium GW2011_GWA1_36_8]
MTVDFDIVKFLNTAGPIYLLVIITFALIYAIGRPKGRK